MASKIIKVEFAGNRRLIGIGSNISNVAIGQAADTAWGGGVIVSLEYVPEKHSLRIRKDRPFEHPTGTGLQHKSFDSMLVPWEHVEFAGEAEEKSEAHVDPLKALEALQVNTNTSASAQANASAGLQQQQKAAAKAK